MVTNLFKCPRCGRAVSSGEDYCPNCGEPLTIRCENCAKTWRYWQNYLFCPKCGTRAPYGMKVKEKATARNSK